jgi:hypothetical protein
MTNAIKVLLQMTSVSLQPVPSLCTCFIYDINIEKVSPIVIDDFWVAYCPQVNSYYLNNLYS